MRWELRLGTVGQSEINGTDDAVFSFKESRLDEAGKFTHVAGPIVLQETGEDAGPEDDGALLVASADAVEEELGERGDVFAALAQGWDGKADGSEAEGEVGEQQALAGHLAQRCLRGSEKDGAAGWAVLKILENAEEESLARRCKEVDTIEISEPGEGGGIGVGGEPLARVAALKTGGGERGAAEEIAGQRVFAAAMLTLNGGDLEMRRGHFSLHEELAPSRTDADDVDGGGGGIELNEREARDGGVRVELRGAGYGCQRASPPGKDVPNQHTFHRRKWQKHERSKVQVLHRAGARAGGITAKLCSGFGIRIFVGDRKPVCPMSWREAQSGTSRDGTRANSGAESGS